MTELKLDKLSINTIRFLAVDAVQRFTGLCIEITE